MSVATETDIFMVQRLMKEKEQSLVTWLPMVVQRYVEETRDFDVGLRCTRCEGPLGPLHISGYDGKDYCMKCADKAAGLGIGSTGGGCI